MRRITTLLALCALSVGGLQTSVDAAQHDTVLASRNGVIGAEGNFPSERPSMSEDGRFVAFQSNASNFPDDPDNIHDVFVRDTQDGTTVLVSRASGAAGAKSNGNSLLPSISGDGRFVAFISTATNIDPDGSATTSGVYVRDLVANTTTLASRASGVNGAKAIGMSPAISLDGRYVAFVSPTANLVTDDPDTVSDVFVRDLLANTTTLVSRATGAAGSKADSDSIHAAISADGRSVAFSSTATLDFDDIDTSHDVFLRDLDTDTTSLVSRASGPSGNKSNSDAFEPVISADGETVVFQTQATNLDPADTTSDADIFLRDTVTHTTTLVSRATGVAGANSDGHAFHPSVSGSGRYVTFVSSGTNLASEDSDGIADIFVRDMQAATTSLVSRASGPSGVKGDGNSIYSAISADGRAVAFDSSSTNLPDATDATSDVFVRDLLGPQAAATLSIVDVKGREGRRGTKSFRFSVRLSAPRFTPVHVDFTTRDVTASAPSDYLSTNGTVTIAPGEGFATIIVGVIGDKRNERREAFEVVLQNPRNAHISDGVGVGLILNRNRKR